MLELCHAKNDRQAISREKSQFCGLTHIDFVKPVMLARQQFRTSSWYPAIHMPNTRHCTDIDQVLGCLISAAPKYRLQRPEFGIAKTDILFA